MLSKTINQKLPTVVYLMYVYLMKMASILRVHIMTLDNNFRQDIFHVEVHDECILDKKIQIS